MWSSCSSLQWQGMRISVPCPQIDGYGWLRRHRMRGGWGGGRAGGRCARVLLTAWDTLINLHSGEMEEGGGVHYDYSSSSALSHSPALITAARQCRRHCTAHLMGTSGNELSGLPSRTQSLFPDTDLPPGFWWYQGVELDLRSDSRVFFSIGWFSPDWNGNNELVKEAWVVSWLFTQYSRAQADVSGN